MKKFGNVALIAVAMAMLTCVGMWGYSDWFPEDGEREFFDYFSDSQIVGFIDDSLVIVADDKEWSQETSDGYAIGGRGHQRLRVFNYRVQENGPRWTDTLDNFNEECNYVLGQLSDSVIWGGRTARYTKEWEGPAMSFWKIGKKPYEMEMQKRLDGCKIGFPVKKLRKWFGGLVLAFGVIHYAQTENDVLNAGGDTCQYAVLDTVRGRLTYKRLNEELKWIQKCDDVRAWGDDVYCLYLAGEPLNLYLSKNDVDYDSLMQGKPYGWASYTKVGFAGNVLNLGNNICEIINNQFSCLEVSIRGNLDFKTEKDTIIY